MEQHTCQDITDNWYDTIPCRPQALSFLIQFCFVFIVFIVLCTVNFVVLYLCIFLVSCIVSLYLWGAHLQAQPSVQPLSLTKIDKNS